MAKKLNRKERAIDFLESYRDLLSEISDRDSGATWKVTVRAVLLEALGIQSTFVKTLDETHFTKKIGEGKYEFNPNKREAFRDLLNAAIEYIEHYGLYVPPKSNIMSHLGPFGFYTSLLSGAAVVVAITLYFSAGQKSEKYSDLLAAKSQLEQYAVQQEASISEHKTTENNLLKNLRKKSDSIRQLNSTIDSLKKLIPKPLPKKPQ